MAQIRGTQPEGLASPGVDRFRVLVGGFGVVELRQSKQTEVLVYCFGGRSSSTFHH